MREETKISSEKISFHEKVNKKVSVARLQESVLSATNREARKYLQELKRFLLSLSFLSHRFRPDRFSDLINL